LVRGTLAASEGAKTPTVAVIDVVGGLSQWIGKDDMMHVAHLLCSQHSAELLDELRSIRASMKAKGVSLDQADTHETTGDKTTSTVQTSVRARISIYRDGQWVGDVRDDYRTWTFQLVRCAGGRRARHRGWLSVTESETSTARNQRRRLSGGAVECTDPGGGRAVRRHGGLPAGSPYGG
jgi:hypothetical protein